jgi:hypothetical protein
MCGYWGELNIERKGNLAWGLSGKCAGKNRRLLRELYSRYECFAKNTTLGRDSS